MALIAEYETSSPTARDALRAAPGMELDHEAITFTPEGELRWTFWGSGGAFDVFEAVLANDDSVGDVEVLTRIEGRRLYQATVRSSPGVCVYATMTEAGIQLLDVTHTSDRTVHRVRCPSREAYAELKRVWEESGCSFHTRRLFTEMGGADVGTVLTPKQRETLCLAHDRGYFRVPRETSLATIAQALEISETAASQRIRRGIRTMVGEHCES